MISAAGNALGSQDINQKNRVQETNAGETPLSILPREDGLTTSHLSALHPLIWQVKGVQRLLTSHYLHYQRL